MAESESRLSVASLYRLAVRMHSALPYHFSTAGRALPAWHYFFEVTRRCNLRCAMCQYLDWYRRTPPEEQRAGELTTQEWKDAVGQTGRGALITFTGGEPWVREDFAELLEYASARRRTHFISNGTRIDGDTARFCVEQAPRRVGGRGLGFIGLSLEGPREVHDGLLKQPGAFDRTLGALEAIAEARQAKSQRTPLVHVTAVLQEGNVESLPELVPLVAQAGADILNLTLEIRFPSLEGLGTIDPAELPLDSVQLPRIAPDAVRRCLDALRVEGAKAGIDVRMPSMPDEQIVAYYSGGLRAEAFRCLAPWTNLFVGAKGDVFPCMIQTVGNIRETSLRAIWNGPELCAFRRRLRKGLFRVCAGCCEIQYAGK